MLASIRELSARIRQLDKELRQLKTSQVFQTSPRQDAKAIVDEYFREVRERLLLAEQVDLSAVDDGMHALLEIAQKNSMVSTYRRQLKELAQGLFEVEKHVLTHAGAERRAKLDTVDVRIIETLSGLVPSAARSYKQATTDLLTGERLSWRGPATDLRESLRETLDHLAPDEEVTAAPGFKLERDTNGPTMKQKVRHVLKKRGAGKAELQSPEAATQGVDEMVGTFVRGVYTRSSVSTHTPTDKKEVLRVRDWVRVAMCELLEIRVD
jgi:hypothetical protein